MALRCDLIIRDATIIDGTGAASRRGDIGVTGDRIVAVGDLGGASADPKRPPAAVLRDVSEGRDGSKAAAVGVWSPERV